MTVTGITYVLLGKTKLARGSSIKMASREQVGMD